ncbi:uncharacterized protein [Euwallacea fornicatus]|uniref:uncharacterized protein n=1 Tax=Euwallacea fornicatus TaxID=995702 RepID=UPI003390134B
MAEGTYEYECMRAELLGIEKPDYEDFMKKKADELCVNEENIEVENMKEEYAQNERLFDATGKLDELNNILKSTQKRINNFTAPFSRFVRSKIGKPHDEAAQMEEPDNMTKCEKVESSSTSRRDPNQSLGMIDRMIDKCETAQLSMERQSRLMKKFM